MFIFFCVILNRVQPTFYINDMFTQSCRHIKDTESWLAAWDALREETAKQPLRYIVYKNYISTLQR